jgi:transposase
MGNYLKMANKLQVQALLELGWSYRRIERETGVRRETISRYANEPDPNAAKVTTGSVTPGSAERHRSLAAAHHDFILAGVKGGLTAQRIFEDLVADRAFGGSYESVKRYVRVLRKTHREVADVMHSAPGAEAQVDFFAGPATLDADTGRWRRPWIFKMTLCCSRHSYEEAMFGQKIPEFIRAHEAAFRFFSGVPKVVRLDNLKAGVTRSCLYDPDIAEVYASFAHHYGFTALPCAPRKPEEKGKVERGCGYVKNALKGRTFASLGELNAFLERRNRTVAALRIHGTTRRQVLTHFLEEEQSALAPVPVEPFSLFTFGTRTVHPDGHVQIAGAYYSVPHTLVGREVEVRFDDRLVRVFHGGKSVAVHVRRLAKGIYATDCEHRPEHKPAREAGYMAWLLARAERIGPAARAWAIAAEEDRGVRAYRLIQGMLSLSRNHPVERVAWACGAAHEARSYRYNTLTRLLDVAEKRQPTPRPALTQTHELIRPLTDYTEEISSDEP